MPLCSQINLNGDISPEAVVSIIVPANKQNSDAVSSSTAKRAGSAASARFALR